MTVTEFFDDFSSIDTDRWQTRTSGSGSVTASGSNAVLDEGGTNNDDCAAIVLKEALDFTAEWIFACMVKINGAAPSYAPNLVGIYDDSAVPDIGTNSSRSSRQRFYIENQIGTSTPSNNRHMYKFRNPSGSTRQWRGANEDWSSAFAYSHVGPNENNYCLLVIHHKPGSGLRICGYGRDQEDTNSNHDGIRLRGSTTFVDFGAGANNIDGIDNAGYLVIGDIVNDAGGYDHTVSVEWASMFVVQGDDAETAFVSCADNSANPFPYDIHQFVCPLGAIQAGHPLYVPLDEHPDSTEVISRGSDDYVQDASVFHDTDTGTYYVLYGRRESGGTAGHIVILSGSTLANALADTPTDIIDYNDTGIDGDVDIVRAPQLWKEGGTFYLFFAAETPDPLFYVYRATLNGSDPTSAANWGSITEVLGPSASSDTYDEGGCAHQFVIRYDTGKYRMVFSGYNSTQGKWSIGMAEATSITGSWTKQGELVARGTDETQFNGANTSSATYTVDDSSDFVVNQPVVTGGRTGDLTRYRPSRIKAINSGTEVVLYHRIGVADNAYLSGYTNFSIAARALRPAPEGGRWEMWITAFRYQQGQEVVARLVSAESESTDPSDCTFTISTDHGFPWVGASVLPNDTHYSEENIGFIWTMADLLLIQPGAYLKRMEHSPAPNPLLRM